MTAPAASPVATPTADTSTATSGDPLDSLFDNDVPVQDFSIEVARESTAKPGSPGESIAIQNGEPVAPVAAPAKPAAEAVQTISDDDSVGEPNSIDKGRVRGPDGRFLKGPEASGDPPPTAADSKGDDKGAAIPAAPFKYRALGQTKVFEGATVDPTTGAVTIAPEKVGQLREALNAREARDVELIPTFHKVTKENADLKAQIASQAESTTLRETQATAQMAALDKALMEPDDEKAVEAFFKMRQDMPTLLKNAEVEYWKKQANRPAPVSTAPAVAASAPPARSAPSLPTAEEAQASVTDHIETLKIDHAFHDLTDADWQQFQSGTTSKPLAYIRPAVAKDVQDYGVTLGEPVFDTDLVDADITAYAARLRTERAAAARQVKLAADNSRRTQPAITAPPTVERATPKKADTGSGINSKSDLDKWFDSPEL